MIKQNKYTEIFSKQLIEKSRNYAFTFRRWSRDGAMVRALGFESGHGVISGLRLLLVLVLVGEFFSGFSGFLPSTTINISKFEFDQDRGPA